MSFIMRPIRFAPTGHIIEGSGLFNGSSGYLSRTPASAGNRKTFILDIICKRSKLGADERIFEAQVDGNNFIYGYWRSNNTLEFSQYTDPGYDFRYNTNQVFRDVASYMNLRFEVDTTAGTGERVKIFLNGTRITSFATATEPSVNFSTDWNTTNPHYIGYSSAGSGQYFTGYASRFVHLDGQTSGVMAEVTDDGFWSISDASGLTFGTNGFLIEGGANVSIGNDTSVGAALTGTWESSAVSTANVSAGGTYTFSSQDIGTAASNRNIIVVASTGGGTAACDFAATCTVGGTSIPRIVDLEGEANNDISVYQGVIASGTSADIVFTVSGNTMEKCGLAVHALYGDKVSLNDTYTQAATTAAPSGAVDVPAGGVIIAANKIQGNGTARTTSWTNATEVYDQTIEANSDPDTQSGTYTSYTSAATVTVTGTASGTTHRNSLVVMSFSTGNNFTKTGTITATNDSPTNDADDGYGNYATMNPLNSHANTTLSQGNLDVDASVANNRGAASTIPMSSGKWYWEATISSGSINGSRDIGICGTDSNFIGTSSSLDDIGLSAVGWLPIDATLRHLTNSTSYGTTGSTGAVVMFALDMDAQKLWIGKDGTWFTSGGVGVPDAGTNAAPTSAVSYTWPDAALAAVTVQATRGVTYNFGATDFAHAIGAGNDTEGFLPINTANLPTPDVINYEDHYYIEAGISHSNGSTTAVTLPKSVSGGAMVRIKRTDSTSSWYVFDTVRGANKFVYWDSDAAEDTSTFNDQNLTGTTLTLPGALATGTYLIEVFYVGSYFQIHSFSGTGSAHAESYSATLDTAPGMMYIKNRDTASRNGIVYHTSVGATKYLRANANTAATTSSTRFNDTEPTTTAFTVGTENVVNASSEAIISYHWANSGPFSFGSYTGNGGNGDAGPFINVGGHPQSLFAKKTTSSTIGWIHHAGAYNDPVNANETDWYCAMNTTGAIGESTGTSGGVGGDFVSTGWKHRGGYTDMNASGVEIIYGAFGIQPIQGDGKINQGRAR